jgi:lipopolysaccharide export system permease protein
MKKIIFRKLLLDCLSFFLLSLIGIGTIIWVFQAVNFLDIMIEDGRNYNVYLSYTLLNFPKIISRILPFTLFFSFTYTILKYESSNELIIFWNHGISKLRVVNFFLFFSIILMLIQIVILSFIVPKSQEIARAKLRSSDIDYFEGLIKPKKFNDTIKGLTIFAEEKNVNDEFKNIYIKKKSSNDKFQVTVAKKGIFELKNNKRILVLYDGKTLNSNNGKITNFDFSKSDYGLSSMDSHLVVHKKLQEQPTIILIDCLKTIFRLESREILNCDKNNPRDVFKELFKRIISPLYLPLLILTSISLILSSKENVNYSKYKFLVFIFGFLIIILSESSLGYINNNIYINLFLLALPITLIFILYSVFIYKLKLDYRKI